MDALLGRLGLADDDRRELLAAPGDDPALVEERRLELVAGMGDAAAPAPKWPFDPAAPWLHLRALLATLPDVRRFHAERGIADETSWATLADLGRHTALDRLLHGSPGLRKGWWLALHFRGLLYELGRLQFELRRDDVSVHIPESGRLDGRACDDSFAHARALFPGRELRCTSWLLDPQLAEYLHGGSNILRFQRRFEPETEGAECDAAVLAFVFHRLRPDLDDLPQRTTLERALVAHLRAGRHWHAPRGRLAG